MQWSNISLVSGVVIGLVNGLYKGIRTGSTTHAILHYLNGFVTFTPCLGLKLVIRSRVSNQRIPYEVMIKGRPYEMNTVSENGNVKHVGLVVQPTVSRLVSMS